MEIAGFHSRASFSMARRSTLVLAAAAALFSLTAATPALATDGLSVHVVARNLDNPRGVALGHAGRIFVAEAGSGGSACTAEVDPESGEPFCLGMSGAITQVWHGQKTIERNLASWISGTDSIGPVAVAADPSGRLITVFGGADPTAAGDLLPSRAYQFGKEFVGHINPAGVHADILGYEAVANPDGGAVDSDPYGVAALADGSTLVADAGGNDLVHVDTNGAISTVAVFPSTPVAVPTELQEAFGLPPMFPAEAVPTSVTVGLDGAWYVGELRGFPFVPGSARIWRIEPGTTNALCDPAATSGACTLWADGLTNTVGTSFGPDGNLYVSEIAKDGLFSTDALPVGAVLMVDADTRASSVVYDHLDAPGGLVVDGTGAIYVSNCSVCGAGAGTVLKIQH